MPLDINPQCPVQTWNTLTEGKKYPGNSSKLRLHQILVIRNMGVFGKWVWPYYQVQGLFQRQMIFSPTFFIKKMPDFVEQIEGILNSFPCFWPTSEGKQDSSSLRSLKCLLMQSCSWRNPGPVLRRRFPCCCTLSLLTYSPSRTREPTSHFAGWGANLAPFPFYLLIFKLTLFETYLTPWCCQL